MPNPSENTSAQIHEELARKRAQRVALYERMHVLDLEIDDLANELKDRRVECGFCGDCDACMRE